jgi:hypothetical protein
MSGSNDNAVQRQPDPAAVARQLKPLLDELEGSRVGALARRTTARMVGGVVGGCGLLLGLLIAVSSSDGPVLGAIVAIGSVAIGLAIYNLMHGGACAGYLADFKSRAFSEAVRVIAPGVSYTPASEVPIEEFKAGGLFASRIDRYRGEDCLAGMVGATRILCSELRVERRETTTDSKGNRQTRWVTVFRGIYFIADFNKDFNCRVSIVPDIAEANFGWLGRKVQALSSDLVRLENPDFERAFKVCASDQVQARYLLTPDMQERLLAQRAFWNANISIALLNSQLHLAIPLSNNWFEPDIHQPANSGAVFATFLTQLVAILHIPDALDLNTRIWTKE